MIHPDAFAIAHASTEYERVNENIRALLDVRFKLLAFLPVFGGVALFLLSNLGFAESDVGGLASAAVVAVVSLLAFMATLGIVLYDQRNSELYNALVHRAKYLESLFASPPSPGALRETASGGQFSERPPPQKLLFGKVRAKHDVGLAFVYGPLLGAWIFPFLLGFFGMFVAPGVTLAFVAALGATAGAIVATRQLIRLDEDDAARWQAAAQPS
jgi:hypothetical protein